MVGVDWIREGIGRRRRYRGGLWLFTLGFVDYDMYGVWIFFYT